jgi:hypothetical protein
VIWSFNTKGRHYILIHRQAATAKLDFDATVFFIAFFKVDKNLVFRSYVRGSCGSSCSRYSIGFNRKIKITRDYQIRLTQSFPSEALICVYQ